MNVFAIIVIYNGMRNGWIQKCFDSIINSSIKVGIIAIDNGSTDGSISFIKQNYPKVELLVSKENLGFGKANNIGLKRALDLGGDFFFLLNQDAWVDQETIEKLIIQSEMHPEYGVISPMHLNGKGDGLDYKVAEYYIKPSKCPQLISDAFLNKLKDDVYKIDFINAAAWLITKKCLEVVGGFSPTFYHYGEDENYCHRLHYKQFFIGLYPTVNVCHDREEREDNIYFETNLSASRKLLIQHSNPSFSNERYTDEIKGLKNHLLRSLLHKNADYKRVIRERIKFLVDNKEKLQLYKEMSKGDSPFVFLQNQN